MKWVVEWRDDAILSLAAAYMNAADQAAMTAAAHRLELALAADPLAVHESAREGLYCATLPPLRLFYEVHATARTVVVTALGYFP